MNSITFEKLGLTFHINRYFEVFGTGLRIHWYAVIILVGVLLGFFYASRFAKKENLETDTLYDVLLWGLPSAIVMARLYYVVFHFSRYRDNLWDVFRIWQGGIAIYGAVIGGVVSTYIYAKVKKRSVFQLFDMGAFGLIVGQAIGRWGNFVNQEAFGTNTNSIFAMSGNVIRAQLVQLQKEGYALNPDLGVHPTFLYESLWNLLGAVVLGLFHKKKKHHGQIFFLYLLWYGVGRFFIEGLRVDSLYFFSFRISQIVALCTAIAGLVMLIYFQKKPIAPMPEEAMPPEDSHTIEEDVVEDSIAEEHQDETKQVIFEKEIKRNETQRRH